MVPVDRFVCETSFRVRYAETDNMGVVHHAVYLVWFEEGRSAFIRERGWSYAEIEKSGYFLAASELTAKYSRAARYDQAIRVKTWLQSDRSRTLTFNCEIVDARSDKLLFEASLTLICLNARGAVTRIPASWRSWLDS
ncbi:MAG: thioesterase family protein [Chloroflexi bacterium]|nr:thioesterase family protein [Chloroflexota bacterium]